jgi:hypothetical protein
MRDTVGNDGFALWCSCAVFLQVGNGDCLGFDLTRSPDDPAVAYLVHDGRDSRIISKSFTEFLDGWTLLSFIGPESWLLSYWLDAESESIDPGKHMTSELRGLLSPRMSTPTA